MIFITPVNKTYYTNNKARQVFSSSYVSDLIEQGNNALSRNRFNEALGYYNKASKIEPENINIYKKIAKAQFGLKNYKNAEDNYKIYLKENPKDIDIIIELGETQRQNGYYNNAIDTFKKACELDETNDLARRSLLEAKNDLLYISSPQRAIREKTEYANKNLRAALQLTVEYLSPEYMNNLRDVKFQFGKTASMGGTSNIAQYENNKQSITVSNSYIYASPQVIAAYLTHESVHAHDNDAYTSIKEEQDAYETATKFWIKNANGVKDPEMDYAADLYKKSPSMLQQRVEEIYTLRDSSIAKTSPNHPPEKFFNWINLSKEKAAAQSVRAYDIIA